MRRVALLAVMSVLAALLVDTPARAQPYPEPDRVGIYFDTSAMGNSLVLAPSQSAMAYLILTNPSGTGIGIDGFECRVNFPATTYRLGTLLPSGALNISTLPDMRVGCAWPLPSSTAVVLATMGFINLSAATGTWTVTPVQDAPPAVPGAMAYSMTHIDHNMVYIMQPSHVPAAVINPDLTFAIDVQPDESLGAWRLSGPAGYQYNAQGDTTLSELPFGSYTITWEATGVWAPPTPSSSTRTHDQWSGACVLSGVYQQRAQVAISIQPPGLAAPWFLLGPDGFWLQGAGDRALPGIAPGTYTVIWAPFEGWRTPEPSSAMLTAAVGDTIAFEGRYHSAAATPGADDSPAAAPRLLPARPNPFNPRTTLRFELPAAAHARLEIFDLAGRRIRTLMDASLSAGSHDITWDGTDARGRAAPSGNYVARLMAGMEVRSVGLQLVR